MNRWPHQIRGVSEVIAARERGERRICLTSPTGTGKSLMISDLIGYCIDNYLQAVLYTERKMLVRQLTATMSKNDIKHGVRAADYEDQRDLAIQVSSLPTEYSRVLKRETWELHKADLVIVDECHSSKGPQAQTVLQRHHDAGATIVGITATPIDLYPIYESLIVAGTNSEGRACGALVPCRHFGCDEPDLRHIGPVKIGEDLSESQNRKAIMVPGIFGRVYDWWKKLNPDALASIAFGPDVPSTVWFCEQFAAKGVPCAEIDGKECWLDGKSYPTSDSIREDILGKSKDGSVKIVWNRFVLREGIDMPWLYHGILATVFGSLQSYLQSVGRLLRSYPGISEVILQDHGGSWWRHGSANIDRAWRLNQSSKEIALERTKIFTGKKEQEPIRCPQCGQIRAAGPSCSQCGFQSTRKVRPVVQADGTLKEYVGDIYRPRVTKEEPDTHKKWKQVYFRAKNSKRGMTFNQARGLFFREFNYWPPMNLPFMPIHEGDWQRRVSDVPYDRLFMAPREPQKIEEPVYENDLFEEAAC